MSDEQSFENQYKIVEYDNILYLLNFEERTSVIIGSKGNLHENIIIPGSIKHESKKYYVTSILSNAFKSSEIKFVEFSSYSKLETICNYAFYGSTIKSIKIPSSVTSIGECAFNECMKLDVIEIPNDSELQTIGKDAFFGTNIKSIRIPSKLVDLREGWCNGVSILTKIVVSPKNPRYCFFDDKMIIGKSIIEQSNYDCLVFVSNDVQKIKIPNFVEHILPYSFRGCDKLEVAEFSNDSKLQTIGKEAFSITTIRRIRFPSSLTSIGEKAFFWCEQLAVVEFSNNSNILTIGEYAFHDTFIKSIKIPASVKTIGEGAFLTCEQLEVIEISDDSMLQTIGKDAFFNSKIASIRIPKSVTSIGENAFSFCINLCIIEVTSSVMISMYQEAFINCSNILLMKPVHS